ncbi:DoxX family protein [Chryseobacterium indologenes]|uniref:DoxX family protein n=1 Tax=Chryseobacterium indologenes TaxID=253 RepID=UPI0009A1DAAA|nr:DoxX family protein [Chryseobacterium indologenes]
MKKITIFFNRDKGLFFFRMIISMILYINHGHEKLFHFSEMLSKIADPLHIGKLPGLLFAAFSDVFCALLLLLGFKTKIASFVIAFNTLVAFILVQHGDVTTFRGEIALLFFSSSLLLFFTGPGIYSLDEFMKKTE